MKFIGGGGGLRVFINILKTGRTQTKSKECPRRVSNRGPGSWRRGKIPPCQVITLKGLHSRTHYVYSIYNEEQVSYAVCQTHVPAEPVKTPLYDLPFSSLHLTYSEIFTFQWVYQQLEEQKTRHWERHCQAIGLNWQLAFHCGDT